MGDWLEGISKSAATIFLTAPNTNSVGQLQYNSGSDVTSRLWFMRGSLFATRRRQRPHCRIHRYYSLPSLHIAMFKRTKALDFQRERPVLEHKSRSRADLHKHRVRVANAGSYSLLSKFRIDLWAWKINCRIFFPDAFKDISALD